MKNILLYTMLLLSLTTLSQTKHMDSVDYVRTINMYKKLEVKLQNNINFQNTNLKTKLIEIDLLNESLVKTKKQLKRQKIYKWIFVINSIGLGYYIIK
jgi:hypothetical protein